MDNEQNFNLKFIICFIYFSFHYLIDIIKKFLLTIDKDIFIQWFIRSSEKNKIDINNPMLFKAIRWNVNIVWKLLKMKNA